MYVPVLQHKKLTGTSKCLSKASTDTNTAKAHTVFRRGASASPALTLLHSRSASDLIPAVPEVLEPAPAGFGEGLGSSRAVELLPPPPSRDFPFPLPLPELSPSVPSISTRTRLPVVRVPRAARHLPACLRLKPAVGGGVVAGFGRVCCLVLHRSAVAEPPRNHDKSPKNVHPACIHSSIIASVPQQGPKAKHHLSC